MKAIILVAGYATRLYPLTMNTPKPLLKVGGKAIIDYIVDVNGGRGPNSEYYNNHYYDVRNFDKASLGLNEGDACEKNGETGKFLGGLCVLPEETCEEDGKYDENYQCIHKGAFCENNGKYNDNFQCVHTGDKCEKNGKYDS